MISIETLHYTFSTIPQVLSALVAIMAAFVHFRLLRLQDYLVGDGQSVINRWNEEGYKLSHKEKNRMVDAVARRNIYEIEAITKSLCKREKEEGYTIADLPTGLQYLYEVRFRGTKQLIRKIKSRMMVTAGIAIFSISLSLCCLALVDGFYKSMYATIGLTSLNIIFTVITLVMSYQLLVLGLLDKDKHETDRN